MGDRDPLTDLEDEEPKTDEKVRIPTTPTLNFYSLTYLEASDGSSPQFT